LKARKGIIIGLAEIENIEEIIKILHDTIKQEVKISKQLQVEIDF